MKALTTLIVLVSTCLASAQTKVLVLQSDFGQKDGAVAAMKGVALSVSPDLIIHDLTHEIPAFNIWEGAYRLDQTAPYWPAGTVFVSVVDPGVGSDRKAVVMRSKSGHFFVTPDNGTLTLVAEHLGIAEVRIIDEARNRLPRSGDSYTFHGRDIFAYTAARLAAGLIQLSDVGTVAADVRKISYERAKIDGAKITGTIDILDIQYGNVWTNIPSSMLRDLKISYGDKINVLISKGSEKVFEGPVVFGRTFADVGPNEAVAYVNSLGNLSVASHQASFADKYNIKSGPEWSIAISKK